MYLMGLSNGDYVVATIFFALIFLTAYLFRRKQQTAAKFLGIPDGAKLAQINSWVMGFGVIELVAAGAIGAIYGISGLYHILTLVFISFVFIYYISKKIYPDSVYEYIANKAGPKISAFYAIFCVILLLFWLSITVVLTSKLFLSLLGWNFVNSVFGITLLTLVSIEVGGYAGIKYNRGIWLSIIGCAFIVVVSLALYSLPDSIANLHKLAVDQGRDKNLYTSFNYAMHIKDLLGASIFILILFPLLTTTKVNRASTQLMAKALKVCLFILMVICGVLAIATPANNINNSKNSKIVTYQAQLPDGQMGYIVKSVEVNDGSTKNPVPGIIPPLLNPKTSLVEPGKYDYKLANVVMFRHYLPARIMFLVVLTIMAAFIYTLSHYLVVIAGTVAFNICPPLGLLVEYGEEGKLWCLRVTVIFAGAISLFGGYFLQNWFNPIGLSYILFTSAAALLLFLLAIIYGKK